MAKIEIDKHEPLQPGDKIEMHFKALGPNWVYLRAGELAILKWQLAQKNQNYELLSWQSPGDKLILTFRVIEPPQPDVYAAGVGTAAVIAALVIGGGLFTWLSLETVYKITDSPAGKVALAGAGSLGIGTVIIAGLLAYAFFFRK